jgi:hypothetical protein
MEPLLTSKAILQSDMAPVVTGPKRTNKKSKYCIYFHRTDWDGSCITISFRSIRFAMHYFLLSEITKNTILTSAQLSVRTRSSQYWQTTVLQLLAGTASHHRMVRLHLINPPTALANKVRLRKRTRKVSKVYDRTRLSLRYRSDSFSIATR